MNLLLKLHLPPELSSPFLRVQNNVLCFLTNFHFQDVTQTNKSYNMALITSMQLPIDYTFLEPYLYRYSCSIRSLNRVKYFSQVEHQQLCQYNFYLFSDLFFDKSSKFDYQRYMQRTDNPRENFLFAQIEPRTGEIQWNEIQEFLNFKLNNKLDGLKNAKDLTKEQLAKKILVGSRNLSQNFSLLDILNNPHETDAIKFFEILSHKQIFPSVQSALEYYGYLSEQDLKNVSVAQYLQEIDFGKNKKHKEYIMAYRMLSKLSTELPIAFVTQTKHFKQVHINSREGVSKDLQDCQKCQSKETECSLLINLNLKMPIIYPLEMLFVYPLDGGFLNLINQTATIFIERLIQCIRAAQFKKTFQINTSIQLLNQALTTQNVGPITNYEVLEVLGDSVMKFITSSHFYLFYINQMEDFLTQCRTQFIKNSFLAKITVTRQFFNYIVARNFYNKYIENFHNSNYKPEERSQIIVESQLADVYEAILGAIFKQTWNMQSVVEFMRDNHFPFPDLSQNQHSNQILFKLMNTNSEVQIYAEDFFNPEPQNPKYPLDQYMEVNNLSFSEHQKFTIEEFQQKILKYKFRNIKLLEEALQYPGQDKKDYQRLEYFGDAAIETFVINNNFNQLYNRYYQQKYHQAIRDGTIEKDCYICPGMLHQSKTVLLDNGFMATMALLHGYHTVIQDLPHLQQIIVPQILAELREMEKSFITIHNMGKIIPKCFGDVWESVAAAILLDGGWEAFFNSYGMMYKPFCKYICQDIENIYKYYQKLNYEIQMNLKIQELNNQY